MYYSSSRVQSANPPDFFVDGTMSLTLMVSGENLSNFATQTQNCPILYSMTEQSDSAGVDCRRRTRSGSRHRVRKVRIHLINLPCAYFTFISWQTPPSWCNTSVCQVSNPVHRFSLWLVDSLCNDAAFKGCNRLLSSAGSGQAPDQACTCIVFFNNSK